MAKKTKLNEELIIKIYNDIQAGKSIKEIKKETGVSESTIRRIKNLDYPYYKEVIEKYKQSNKKIIKPETNSLSEIESETDILTNKILNLNNDILKNDLIKILSTFLTPRVLKWIYDELLSQKAINTALDETIKVLKQMEINEAKNKYSEMLQVLTVMTLSNIVNQEFVEIMLVNLKNIRSKQAKKDEKNKN